MFFKQLILSVMQLLSRVIFDEIREGVYKQRKRRLRKEYLRKRAESKARRERILRENAQYKHIPPTNRGSIIGPKGRATRKYRV